MRHSGIRKAESKNWSGMKAWLFAVSFISLGLLLPQAGFAAWSDNPIAVAVGANEECRSQVVYDGSGGYYVVWQDNTDHIIFAQHYDAQGDATWAAPLQVSPVGATNANQQESTADGSGGLLVSWNDDDSYIRVQRVNADGTVEWTDGGVVVIDNSEPWIAADGSGGAIVMSYYGSVNRIAADGSLPWGAADAAKPYSTNASATKIVSDGAGGAILLWKESDAFDGLAVQRIDSNGNFLWNGGDPLPISADGASIGCPRLINQGSGAVVVWYESDEIRAQKINGNGVIQWDVDGKVVASLESPGYLGLAADGAGGAFITWDDGNTSQVRSQYINASGVAVWGALVAMSTDADVNGFAFHPQNTIADGQGGFITTWYNDSNEIRAQRCNAAGERQWTDTGALLATGDSQDYPPKLTSNGQGGAVMVWVDNQVASGSNDVFMQGVSASGVAGEPGYTPPSNDDDGGGSSGCFVNTIGTF